MTLPLPETRYARSGDVHIAYHVFGSGPVDLVIFPAFITHLEQSWESKDAVAHFERLSEFSRVIRFDKRGTGLSDRTDGIADMETRMDDVRAVMDAAGSERAVIFGLSEGGPLSALFAATYPERVLGLIIFGSFPRVTRAPGYPWGPTREEELAAIRNMVARWGTREYAVEALRGAGLDEPTEDEIEFWSRRWRTSASPGDVERLELMNLEIDVRDVLPSIRVPTLVMHRTDDSLPVGAARWMAERIPTARFVEFPGSEHGITMGDAKPVEDEIRTFVKSLRDAHAEPDETERVLATVLFTDIVGSTQHAVELGDRRWRELVSEHHRTIRRELARFRGRELDTAGDGFFAAFDGPARAIRCACSVSDAVRELGLEVRAGLHTGECEVVDGKIGGIAVHIGARVAARAAPSEVLVSQTVRDLVAGSGLEFDEHGEEELKGVPGTWRLYAVSHR